MVFEVSNAWLNLVSQTNLLCFISFRVGSINPTSRLIYFISLLAFINVFKQCIFSRFGNKF